METEVVTPTEAIIDKEPEIVIMEEIKEEKED
jgi:hypothetical protein